MIQLFAKGTTDFSKNGIRLRPQESTVTYTDNGQFTLEMVVPAGEGYTSFDYGQILEATVPQQDLAAVSLGEVSYYTVTNANGANLYSRLPTTKRVSYSPWTLATAYGAGSKVTYNGHNYSANSAHYSQPGNAPGSGPWTRIADSTTSAGKVAATLAYGDTIMKTADFNSSYMQAASVNGKNGYISINDCEATGESEERIVPARSIRTQLFVITEIRKEQSGQAIRVTAEHISYQLGRTILGDCSVVKVTPATALLFISGAMKESYPGNLYTDMTEPEITSDWSWKNAQNAILDPKSGLLALCGGRLIRDNMDVFVLTESEKVPVYSIRYGANMKSVKWSGDVSDIVTRIYPTAQTEDGDTLLLPEEYIDTVRPVPFIRPEVLATKMKIGQKEKQSDGTEIKLTEDIIITRMREQANNRFTIDKCDQAVIKLELDWQHMPETVEYAQYSALKNAMPGDWVEVVNGPLGISELIRMTGYTWDPMLEVFKGATFGENKTQPTVAGYSLKNGSVGSAAIAAGAVGSGAIQQESITAREIMTSSLTADKIASKSITTELIMAGAVTSDEISANAITTEKLIAGSVTADKIGAGEVTAVKIAANAINAGKIDANDITAIVAKLGAAHITNGVIDNAQIGFANVVDASIQSLIARDAVTDKYFIDKLAVRNAQMVEATVGELVIKASDNKYYRLDIDEYGALSPTEVTLTAAEIAAGETSNGHGTIIETDLTVADLSASNMKGINALIDKLTASRIDVDELWARQAFINKLMVQDISSNTYIQATIGNWTSSSTITQSINSLDSRISSLGYGTVYMQPEEPDHSELVPGDIWIQSQPSGTWEQVYQDYATWETIYNDVSTWQTLGGVPIMWVWDGRKWQKQLDSLESDTLETEIQQNAQQIALLATRTTAVENNKYTIRSGITIEAEGISISGSQFVKIASGGYFQVQTGNFGIDTDSSTYVMWSGASTAANSPFWLKKDGTLHATSGTIGGWNLAANSLTSGSSTSYVNINSNTSNTYAMWAGNETAANAPFRLKRDGSLSITKLLAIGSDGTTETEVNLRTAGLWKLSGNTITSYSSNSITLSNGAVVNFNTAASVTITSVGKNGSDTYSSRPYWTYTTHIIARASNGATLTQDIEVSAVTAYRDGYNSCKTAIVDTKQTKYLYSGGTYYTVLYTSNDGGQTISGAVYGCRSGMTGDSYDLYTIPE